MNKNTNKVSNSFLNEIKGIINESRANVIRSVDFIRVQMYWKIGERMLKKWTPHSRWASSEDKHKIKPQTSYRNLQVLKNIGCLTSSEKILLFIR